jgi:ABC-2 type transport system ATP-binding protein
VEVRGTAAGEAGLGHVAEPPPVRPAPSAAALRLRGISKRWGSLRVLDRVDLAIRPGERAWLGGRNGAGKTTLLRIAAGLIVPDEGEVELEGLGVERDRREFHRRLGLLAAGNTALYARLTVTDNLSFCAGIAFVPRRQRAQAVRETIARFRIEDLAGRRVDRLSMGQRQRVRLASTFLHGPSLVLLDEPETSLDDEGIALLAETLDDHVSGGGAALICSPTRERLGVPVDSGYVIESGGLVAS